MKIFTSRKICSKFIISVVCITLLSFCMPVTRVQAAGTSFGGKMMGLMRDFATGIADVAASLVQFGVTGEWRDAVDYAGTGEPDETSDYWVKDKYFKYPILQISPELIFANQIELLDVNFISPIGNGTHILELENDNALRMLRNIIAGWYVTLRTIAVIGLLSVLIYVGIRIIISSTSADKAKYKQRLLDWVVAFCLLFFMHYIMAAVTTVVEKVDEVLATNIDVTEGLTINPKFGKVIYKPKTTDLGDASLNTNLPEQEYYTPNLFWDTVYDTVEHNIDCVLVGNQVKTLAEAMNSGDVQWVRDAGMGITDEDIARGEYVVKYVSTGDGRTSSITLRYKVEMSTNSSLMQDKPCVEKISFEVSNAENSNIKFFTKPENDIYASTYLENYVKWFNEAVDSKINPITARNDILVAEGAKTDGEKILYFTNYARLFLNVKDKDEYIPMATAYLIIYVALVTFTGVFTIRYIKRVIYVGFLTLIAPMVALTYPIDKIKDRKSTSVGYVAQRICIQCSCTAIPLTYIYNISGGCYRTCNSKLSICSSCNILPNTSRKFITQVLQI